MNEILLGKLAQEKCDLLSQTSNDTWFDEKLDIQHKIKNATPSITLC